MQLVGNTHVVAGGAEALSAVLAHLASTGFDIEQNADLYVRIYAHFGIDEARELRERAGSRALGSRRAFVVAMPGMTNEAQNALLKTLEEPPADALFFFILPSPESLLPTLRSRTQMLALDTLSATSAVDTKVFLEATPAKRLDMLKPLFEKDEDDKRDMAGVLTFLSSLEGMLEDRVQDRGAAEGLESVYRARKYLSDKGSLVKPLLEQVALLVPIMKT